MSVEHGGTIGSAEEGKVSHAWPQYEANYLKQRILRADEKWDTDGLTPSEKVVYLQEVAKHHKDEADECLKQEFKQWLQGTHPVYNNAEHVYTGQAERRHVYNNGNDEVGMRMNGWKPTPWGKAQLTHLPGVRDFLRSEKENAEEQSLKLNLLAEHGPQDLTDAWIYFKHWVAQRPMSEAQCREAASEMGTRPLGPMPEHMKYTGGRNHNDGVGGTRAPPGADQEFYDQVMAEEGPVAAAAFAPEGTAPVFPDRRTFERNRARETMRQVGDELRRRRPPSEASDDEDEFTDVGEDFQVG